MEKDPLSLLTEYARFPSVSTDPEFEEGMAGARNWCQERLNALGFDTKCIETPRHPIILAERAGKAGAPHVLIYAHYDVQPPDPLDLWNTPPFEPQLRDGRLYARGAADNKGPFCIQLAALARVLEKQPDFPLNLTFLIEGEEEMGSPSFPGFLEQYGAQLGEADFVVLSDTGVPDTSRMTITTGLRGLAGCEVHVEGPNGDLHSGVHGGAIRNPASALSELLAGLHDSEGRVNIPGFYDDVVEPHAWERDELNKLPTTEEEYLRFLGVPGFWPPAGYSPFEAVRFMPALDINGMGGGYQGEGTKTIIPARASAKLTCRLVPNQQPEHIMNRVESALTERCPEGVCVRVKKGDGGPPYRVVPPHRPNTPKDQSPVLRSGFEAAAEGIQSEFRQDPIYLREGGSVPIIAQIKDQTGLDSLMLGIFSPEDRLHAPNESFEVKFMERATAVYEHFFLRMSAHDSV